MSQLPTLVDIPPIYSPLRPAIHPEHARIDAHTARWAEEFHIGTPELRRRLVCQNLGTFGARILPDGREEVAALVGDFVLWLFGVDDGCCEEGAIDSQPGALATRLAQLVRVAQNPNAPMPADDPLAEGIRELRRRVDSYGTVTHSARWVDSLREYVLAVVCEAHYRGERTVPDLNDYTLIRLYDGATATVFPLLEVGHGYELAQHERDDPVVRAATEMTSFVLTWDNDLFSLHKETTETHYTVNVIDVLTRMGRTFHEAVAEAIEHRNRVLALFVDIRDRLSARASPDLRQYLRSLSAFIRANQDWGVSSARYLWPDGTDFTTAFQTDLTVSRKPLGIPTIDWWWTLLEDN